MVFTQIAAGQKSELRAWRAGFKNCPIVPVGFAHLFFFFFFFLKYTHDRWDNSTVQRAPNGVEGQRLHMFSPSWSYLFYTSRIQTIPQREIAGLAISKPTHLSWRSEKCPSRRKAWEALKSQLLHSAWECLTTAGGVLSPFSPRPFPRPTAKLQHHLMAMTNHSKK